MKVYSYKLTDRADLYGLVTASNRRDARHRIKTLYYLYEGKIEIKRARNWIACDLCGTPVALYGGEYLNCIPSPSECKQCVIKLIAPWKSGERNFALIKEWGKPNGSDTNDHGQQHGAE